MVYQDEEKLDVRASALIEKLAIKGKRKGWV
jgi:hypothetical protein